jgi:hypothetical protein
MISEVVNVWGRALRRRNSSADSGAGIPGVRAQLASQSRNPGAKAINLGGLGACVHLATRQTRQLTHLTNPATMRTFDITADGKQIVFDRLRNNSDIVLIDLPKQP